MTRTAAEPAAEPAAEAAMQVAGLAERVRGGEPRALARAITLVESSRGDHRRAAEALLEALREASPPHGGGALRIGISGVPGVGKSTFIEAFGLHLIEQGHRLAVLAVDPSSGITGGSILGDKTRMEELSRNPAAYIRPSPTGGTLGGVARRTREAMLICEAAGFDRVIVETVGVGQSETAVAGLVDLFMLLLLPGGGDELQGVKRGIMELADLLVVNKADGDFAAAAQRTASEYHAALQLMRPRSPHWSPPVKTCSALTGAGIADLRDSIEAFQAALSASGELQDKRAQQARHWLWSEVEESLMARLRQDSGAAARIPALEAAVMAGEISPSRAARALLEGFPGALGRE